MEAQNHKLVIHRHEDGTMQVLSTLPLDIYLIEDINVNESEDVQLSIDRINVHEATPEQTLEVVSYIEEQKGFSQN